MKNEIPFRTAYGPRFRVPTEVSGKSLTKGSFQAECDINSIMKKYQKTGVVEHVARTGGRYGDFLNVPEYHEAMNRVLEAQQAFDSLPSSLRKRFEYDPAQFLAFAQDPDNLEEMRSLGLAEPARPQNKADPASEGPQEGGQKAAKAKPSDSPAEGSESS